MMGFTFRGIHTSEFKGLVVKTINNPLFLLKEYKE
jgi:hypothetical protein